MTGKRQKLPYIDLFNWNGLYTKGSPDIVSNTQLQISKNTDFFTSYGSVSKPPGSARALSSIYREDGTHQKMSWIGFYKAANLNGQILRHVLVAGGTILHRIESDGSLTALTGSGKPLTEARTAGLVHSASIFSDLLLIQNQDPDLIGKGNTPVKYDGTDIQRWGVIAPGSLETSVEGFSSASSFTKTNGVAANEATTTQDGAATSFNKTSTGATTGDLEKTITSFSVDNTVPGRARVFLYIPRGQITNFAETTAVSIFLASDGGATTDYYQFDFGVGELVEGWNALFLDLSDSDNIGAGSPDNTALDFIRFRVHSKTAATLITGVVWDQFDAFDVGTPTTAEGTAGDANSPFKNTAVYEYKVTFVSKYGHESNAGPASVSLTLTAARDDIALTAVPTSTDPQVTARKIYRTVNGGTLHLFVDTINDNTTTTFTDTTTDIGLGQTTPPLAGDVSDDNSPPPQAGIVKKWKRTIFLGGMPDNPTAITFSEDDEPESFPTLNLVQLDGKVTAIYEAYSGLVIETELGKWQVTGENPDFKFDKVINNIGCVGRRAAGETRVQGWAVDREGMRIYDLSNPIKISETIRDKFDDDFDKSNLELMHTSSSKSRNAIGMYVADSSAEFKGNNYQYQYPLDDIGQGWWWQLDLPSAINPLDVTEIEDTNGTFRMYMGGDDGMVYELFKAGEKNWVIADGSTEAIKMEFETKYIRLASAEQVEEEYEGRATPRMIELRHNGDAATYEVTITTANGPSQVTATDTRTVTIPFAADETLLRYPIGAAMQPGEYVKLNIKNTEKDIACTLQAIRLIFKPEPGQFPYETGQFSDC
jgi:hypothetical protein